MDFKLFLSVWIWSLHPHMTSISVLSFQVKSCFAFSCVKGWVGGGCTQERGFRGLGCRWREQGTFVGEASPAAHHNFWERKILHKGARSRQLLGCYHSPNWTERNFLLIFLPFPVFVIGPFHFLLQTLQFLWLVQLCKYCFGTFIINLLALTVTSFPHIIHEHSYYWIHCLIVFYFHYLILVLL